MLKQTYTPDNLAKVIRKRHIVRWDMWKNNSEKNSFLKSRASAISQSMEIAETIEIQKINGKIAYLPSIVDDFLKIKLTDYFIRRIYKVVQADRRKIVRQLQTILADGSPYCVLRMDIADFYESIPLFQIIEKIKGDMYLSHEGIAILQSLGKKLSSLSTQKTFGLPRGMEISATLSEIFMQEVDELIKKLNGVFFYARYVDDIIIVHNVPADALIKKVKEIIEAKGLKENEKKRDSITIRKDETSVHDLTYLGYQFVIKEQKYSNEVSLKIASDKINKQKRRIANAFIHYSHDLNFPMLKRRLRFLSGLVLLNKDTRGRLYAGNAFNYSEVTSSSSLKVLDGYIYAILYKKSNRLGSLVYSLLSPNQKEELLKISFHKSHEQKFLMHYSKKQSEKIKKAWGC